MYKGFKNDSVPLIFLGIISAIGFFLIFNMTANPGNPSGNGNPAIVIMIFVIPFYAGFLFWIYKVVNKLSFKPQTILVVSLFSVVILSLTELFYAKSVLNNLNSLSYFDKLGLFNQFTNKIYFNGITFLLIISIVILLVSVKKFKKLKHSPDHLKKIP